jgi:oxygen-independent coproporphyrinogen III oxidase
MERLDRPALGLYFSIPFCRSKCTYCNFASGVYPASMHARYVERIVEDLATAEVWATRMGVALPHRVDSIYLGGGTPSLLAPKLIAQLFAAIHRHFSVDADAEITVECAPGQLSDRTLAALVQAGMNRASLGVQSFVDAEAQSSGRHHTRAIVLDDIARLRAAGVTNFNLDLIAGLAGQTSASWRESLEILLETGTPHASLYMLEVDEESRLGRELIAGGKRYHAALVPTDEAIADMYETGCTALNAAGIEQYEISNFARTGAAARHNLRYWQRKPYLGLGLDASSMLVAIPKDEDQGEQPYVLRSTTTDDLNDYLDQAPAAETGWLSPDRQLEEAWFLGLRLNRGVRFAELAAEFGEEKIAPARPVLARLVEEGLVAADALSARLTPQGRLLSNDVFARFLGLGEED